MFTEVVFRGFVPSNRLRMLAAEILDDVSERCPCGSTPIVLLEKDGEEYHGIVEVYSRQVPFVVSARGDDPDAILREVHETVRHKLALWREHRFEYGRPRRPDRVLSPESELAYRFRRRLSA